MYGTGCGWRIRKTGRIFWFLTYAAVFRSGSDLQRGKCITGAVNVLLARDKEEARTSCMKEALMLHQALSLCSSIAEEHDRIEAAFMEAVRVLLVRLENSGGKRKISLQEINQRINELLKQSIKSEGVINLFSDAKAEFSLFDPKFLADIAKLESKNLALELLRKLILEQVKLYKRTNVVKSDKFSDIIKQLMNKYLNGLLTNEQVIEELLKLASLITTEHKEGEKYGLTPEEFAFYDALTKPENIKDFYENEQLVSLTRELTDTLRRNKTIDWQRRSSARAKMRTIIKRLLKIYKYPPEGMDEAVQTVMQQCELWADNVDTSSYEYPEVEEKMAEVAEDDK